MKDLQKYDVVILGCGPAGLQAAIHAVRRKVTVLVLGKMVKIVTAFSIRGKLYPSLEMKVPLPQEPLRFL